jgi:hypothetical protein
MEELQKQIDELKNRLDLLNSSYSIPLDVDNAFRDRLQAVAGQSSTKLASAETQAVNEAGAGTYSVAKPMDGFVKMIVDGVARNIPYYD